MTLQTKGQISLVDIGQEYKDAQPHLLSEFSEHVEKAPGDTIAISEFYGKSAKTILLQDKTFTVYTTRTTVIPFSNILEGSFDQYSDGNDPVRLINVFEPVRGQVSIDGATVLFTSTGGVDQPASFKFTVENSIGIRKNHVVTMTVEAIPPIICNPDTYNLQQSETLLLPASELTANDEDQSSSGLNVIAVTNIAGGNVTMKNGNITFVSTGLAGEPAEFEYRVRNGQGTEQTGRVYINVTPLPEVESFIYRTTPEVTEARAGYRPPSVQDIFNTWGRFDGNNFYANKSSATGNANAWEFKTNPDRVVMPLNVSPSNGFVSLEKVDNYTLEVTLSSDSSDNDTIGLVAAFKREGSFNEVLTIVLNTGGNDPRTTGCGIYHGYYGTGANTMRLLKEYNIGVGGGWSNKKIRVKVQRQGDIFTFYVTNWNDTANYQPASKMVIDINADPALHRFKGKQSYGYITNSQPNSTYLDEVFKGGLDTSRLYDVESNSSWEYRDGAWVQLSGTIQDNLGYIRKTFNSTTKERFLIKQSQIQYLGKLLGGRQFDNAKILDERQYALIKGNVSQNGAASGLRVLALYAPDQEEKNALKDKPALTTKTAHQNNSPANRFNRVGERNWFDDNGIDLSAIDYVGGTVVFEGRLAGRITAIGNDDGNGAFIFYDVQSFDLFDLTV